MHASCILGPRECPEAAAGRSQVWYLYPSGCCFVLLPSLDSAHSYNLIK